MSNSDAKLVLAEMIRPRTHRSEPTEIRPELGRLLRVDIPDPDLRLLADGQWRVSSPMAVHGHEAKALLDVHQNSEMPAMAVLECHIDNWRLRSFVSLCPVCFGIGLNDDRLCKFCFAVGWGVFPDDYTADSGVDELLEKVLAVKGTEKSESVVRARLFGLIRENISTQSLLAVSIGNWKITGKPLVHEGTAKCLLTDSTPPNTRAVARLTFQEGAWSLAALDAECPVCFGTGVNDNMICGLCFGVGWGTVKDRLDL